MKKIFLTIIYIIVFSTLKAQGPLLQWAKTADVMSTNAGNEGRCITHDASGNIYTTGYFGGTVDFDPGLGTYSLTASAWDTFILKLDAAGNFIWAKNIGAVGSITNPRGIAMDITGNVYVTGYYDTIVDFDPGPGIFNLTPNGSNDVFILKLNSTGNFVWAKNFGGSNAGVGPESITIDLAGKIYITGGFGGNVDFDPNAGISNLNSGSTGATFISKLDTSGNFIWAKCITGSSIYNRGFDIAYDSFGNVYTTGHFWGDCDFDPGPGTYTLDPPPSQFSDASVFISKLDASGNFIWAKKLGRKPYGVYDGYSIAIDASDNVYTTGSYEVGDFDPGPGTYTLSCSGPYNSFISKLDPSGNFIWAKCVGGKSVGKSIAIDAMKNVYTMGTFEYSTDFDPGVGTFSLTGANNPNPNVFILKLDSIGNFQWAGSSYGYVDCYTSSALSIDAFGNVFATGTIHGSVNDVDLNSATYNLATVGNGTQSFVLKMGGCCAGIHELNNNKKFDCKVFPNPSSGSFKLEIEQAFTNGELIIINSLGEKVHTQKIVGGINKINTKDLAKGLYYYSVIQNNSNLKSGKLSIN